MAAASRERAQVVFVVAPSSSAFVIVFVVAFVVGRR
jgi:hypothetical protein